MKKIIEKEEAKEIKKFFQGLGRRKSAIARVRIYADGKGLITVNGKELEKHFPYFEYQEQIMAPLEQIGLAKKVDVSVMVKGGGSRGQAEAIELGIARALVEKDEANKPALRTAGHLSRDPRVKERKKPGLKRARRAPQWTKR
ncbi:MAG: 30S ribosomal protein S9 [Patescibacteria group bacterium]|nr:30S ribosomal protein S9 [Patescibacteria group bacterium]